MPETPAVADSTLDADSALDGEVSLDDLRAEIDRIDDAVLDLLLERIAVVRRIGGRKSKVPSDTERRLSAIALRPAREASIIRRLAARAAPTLPAAALTRMWRELLAATTRLQTPFDVAVLADPAAPHVWALAHDHFGAITPLREVETVQAGFRLIAAGEAELLVLPAPEEGSHWWRRVALTVIDSQLRVVGRLPFCPGLPADVAQQRGALVLGALPEEPTGADLTMLVLETDLDLSRARLRDLVDAGGGELVSLVALADLQPESAFFMLEVEGMATAALAGLRHAVAPLRDRVLRLAVLGSYPQPLPADPPAG